MDCLRINGGVRLDGAVTVSGSKNAALPIMAASILAAGPVVLRGVPELVDVDTLALLLGHLGVEVKRRGATGGSSRGAADGEVWIETVDPRPTRAAYDLVRRMRASFCVLGPLLARRGRAEVSLPGGCNIGTRPVDLHLAGLQALGAEIRIERGYVIAEAPRLGGAEIDLRGPRGPTVTGTANVMSAATVARGRTIIKGAAAEPEVVDLGRFLIAAGADIAGLGTDTIEIRGVDQLAGACHRVIPDRIEAATLLIAAAITRGTATVAGARADHLTAVLEALDETGADVVCGPNEITVSAGDRPRPIDVIARPYPGIPTDLQAQFMALLAVADGTSTVGDEVFAERFMHVAELNRLGAQIERRGSVAVVRGVRRLSGAAVMASDLRASAALVLAGLAAGSETIVRRVYHLDRGYRRLEEKLALMGARIERWSDGEISPTDPENLTASALRC
ncbi:MAG: UDP-N-acetylglucosamine 1-carboxyvinyltransferase [Pirellulales bacterium]